MDIMDIDDDYKNIYGTLIKFKTTLGSDTIMNGATVSTNVHSITRMKQYSAKSFEELRCEDYYLAFQFNVLVKSLRSVASLWV